MIEDAPLLTKAVKINQSEGIPGSSIPERSFVKNSYKRSRTSLPSPPLLFIAFFTLHRSPLSERLEQAITLDPIKLEKIIIEMKTKVAAIEQELKNLSKKEEKKLVGGYSSVLNAVTSVVTLKNS